MNERMSIISVCLSGRTGAVRHFNHILFDLLDINAEMPSRLSFVPGSQHLKNLEFIIFTYAQK